MLEKENKKTEQQDIYNITYLSSHLDLPRDRKTINAWYRSYYYLNEEIHSIIKDKALLFVKYFKIKSNDFFKNQIHILDLENLILQIMTEFYLLGECFVCADLDEANGLWSSIIIQNPDYIIVKRSAIEDLIMLRPDENLRRAVFSNEEKDKNQIKLISSKIIENIKNGENIPLDNFNVTHFANKISPYEVRGTSFLSPLLSLLHSSTHEYLCSFEFREKLKMVLKKFPDKQDSDNYKNVFLQQQKTHFNMIEKWLNKKIFKPIAKIHNISELPTVEFNIEQLKLDIGL